MFHLILTHIVNPSYLTALKFSLLQLLGIDIDNFKNKIYSINQ